MAASTSADGGKQTEQQRRESAVRLRLREQVADRPNAGNRLVAIDRPHRRLRRAGKRSRVARGAEQHEHAPVGRLLHREVELRPRAPVRTRRAGYPPRLRRWSATGCRARGIAERHPPAKRVLVREEARTNDSLTRTTSWARGASARVNIRPRRSGICSVAKKPGVTESYGTGMFCASAGSGGRPSMLIVAEPGSRERSSDEPAPEASTPGNADSRSISCS